VSSASDNSGQQRGRGNRHDTERKNLQEQAFYLSVEGKTCREIAKILNIDKTTASKYIRAEEQIRAEELAERRESEKARRIARLQQLSKLAESKSDVPGSGALGACGKFEEMINRILGVDAPTKIDVGLKDLLNAFDDSATDSGTDKGVPE
jgi:DNA-binding MarR family transcriptional regulator